MPLSPAPLASSRVSARSSLLALAALCAAAFAARAWLQFGTPLAPGMNGAYYFVQARALLETGHLGIPDLPFAFWLHAGLARLVQAVSGADQATAIVFAVKLVDATVPPLVAVPIFLLASQWQRRAEHPSLLAALAPAALACAAAPALSMTGNFQKNSLALVWFAAFAFAARRFVEAPAARPAVLALLWLGLLGLTHVGVLAAALVFLAAFALALLVTAAPGMRRRLLAFATVGTLVLGAAGFVVQRYDANRFQRLQRAFSEPSSVKSDDGPGGVFPPPRGVAGGDFRPDAGPRPPGPPGGLGMGPLRFAPQAAIVAVGLAGLVCLVRRRLAAADFAIVCAAAVSALVLGGPFYDAQKSQRLLLIAVVPAALTLAFLLGQIDSRAVRRGFGAVVLFGAVLSGALYAARGARPVISVAAAAELRTLAPLVAPAARTLVVAHHGLEWWTAWTLGTHIAQPSAVSREDWQRYDRVLYLTENRPTGGPAGFGPPPAGEWSVPPRGAPPFGGPFEAEEPDGAETLHDGEFFRLAAVAAAPADQPSDATIQARRLKRK